MRFPRFGVGIPVWQQRCIQLREKKLRSWRPYRIVLIPGNKAEKGRSFMDKMFSFSVYGDDYWQWTLNMILSVLLVPVTLILAAFGVPFRLE